MFRLLVLLCCLAASQVTAQVTTGMTCSYNAGTSYNQCYWYGTGVSGTVYCDCLAQCTNGASPSAGLSSWWNGCEMTWSSAVSSNGLNSYVLRIDGSAGDGGMSLYSGWSQQDSNMGTDSREFIYWCGGGYPW